METLRICHLCKGALRKWLRIEISHTLLPNGQGQRLCRMNYGAFRSGGIAMAAVVEAAELQRKWRSAWEIMFIKNNYPLPLPLQKQFER